MRLCFAVVLRERAVGGRRRREVRPYIGLRETIWESAVDGEAVEGVGQGPPIRIIPERGSRCAAQL